MGIAETVLSILSQSFGTLKLFFVSYIILLLTWLFYIAIMHLRLVRYQLHPFAKFNAYILLFFGLLLDIASNLVASVVLLDFPREWLLTDKLERMKMTGKWWQRTSASWVCEHLLNQFDSGHC